MPKTREFTSISNIRFIVDVNVPVTTDNQGRMQYATRATAQMNVKTDDGLTIPLSITEDITNPKINADNPNAVFTNLKGASFGAGLSQLFKKAVNEALAEDVSKK